MHYNKYINLYDIPTQCVVIRNHKWYKSGMASDIVYCIEEFEWNERCYYIFILYYIERWLHMGEDTYIAD